MPVLGMVTMVNVVGASVCRGTAVVPGWFVSAGIVRTGSSSPDCPVPGARMGNSFSAPAVVVTVASDGLSGWVVPTAVDTAAICHGGNCRGDRRIRQAAAVALAASHQACTKGGAQQDPCCRRKHSVFHGMSLHSFAVPIIIDPRGNVNPLSHRNTWRGYPA